MPIWHPCLRNDCCKPCCGRTFQANAAAHPFTTHQINAPLSAGLAYSGAREKLKIPGMLQCSTTCLNNGRAHTACPFIEQPVICEAVLQAGGGCRGGCQTMLFPHILWQTPALPDHPAGKAGVDQGDGRTRVDALRAEGFIKSYRGRRFPTPPCRWPLRVTGLAPVSG